MITSAARVPTTTQVRLTLPLSNPQHYSTTAFIPEDMSSVLPIQQDDPTAKLWSPKDLDRTGTHRFLRRINSRRNDDLPHLSSYEDLWNWSTEDVSEFWNEVWDATEVIGQKGSDGAVSSRSNLPFTRPRPGALFPLLSDVA